MNVTYLAIFQLFGVPSDAGYYLPIHGGAVQLYENGRAFCSHSGIVEEGFGPYADLPLPSELESLFVLAFTDAQKPPAKVYGLPTNRHPVRITEAAHEASTGQQQAFVAMDPESLYKTILARYDMATEEQERPHPNYPTNPSKKIKVRVWKPRVPSKRPCPCCAGQGVGAWLGSILLCGACGGSGSSHETDPPSDSQPPRSAA